MRNKSAGDQPPKKGKGTPPHIPMRARARARGIDSERRLRWGFRPRAVGAA